MIKSDGIAVGVACSLIIAAAGAGAWLLATGVRIEVYAPPLFGWLAPRLGLGTPAVIILSIIAIVLARRFAAEQPWRRVMIIGYLAAVAWTVSLAMIDGWSGGLGSRLTNGHEYLHELGRIDSLGAFLGTFTDHILDFQPDSWVTHVAGHPPGVTALFWILQRLGLGGGDWAAVVIVLIGCLAAVAIPAAVSSLGATDAARRIVPFTVFLPGALWVGVSADGLFAGVAAAGLALTVAGVRSRGAGWPVPVIAGGLLLGVVPYLSYGLILYGLVVAAAAGLTLRLDGRRVIGRWLAATGAAALVAVSFTAAGFAWWEGLSLVHTRYYQGVAADRPYAYFVWANLAAFLIMVGPIAAAAMVRAVRALPCSGGLRRVVSNGGQPRGTRARAPRHAPGHLLAAATVRHRPPTWPAAEQLVPAVLSLAGLATVLLADLSGLSKAETERIWLPFGYVVIIAAALLPAASARAGLACSVGLTVVVAHLIWTPW